MSARSVSDPGTVQDHTVMELLDAFAAGVAEGKREERVEKTGDARKDHPRCEAGGRAQVLEVGLAYRLRMLCEEAPKSHGRRA